MSTERSELLQGLVAMIITSVRVAEQTDSKRAIADVLEDLSGVLSRAATDIVAREDLVEHVAVCNQAGCDEPAAFVVDFPGSEKPDGICATHASHAGAVYGALGHRLPATPIGEWVPTKVVTL